MGRIPSLTCVFAVALSLTAADAAPFPKTKSGAISPAPFAELPRQTPPAEPTLERYTGVISIEMGKPASTAERASGAPEKPAAVNGTIYTALSPVFIGDDNNYSFIRLINGDVVTATFNATIVGSPTGRNYGTVVATIPAYASPQFSINDFLNTLGVTGFIGGDTSYSIYPMNWAPTSADSSTWCGTA